MGLEGLVSKRRDRPYRGRSIPPGAASSHRGNDASAGEASQAHSVRDAKRHRAEQRMWAGVEGSSLPPQLETDPARGSGTSAVQF